jgi:hypothetical protein
MPELCSEYASQTRSKEIFVFPSISGFFLSILFLFYLIFPPLHSEQDIPYPVTFTDVTEEAACIMEILMLL